MKRGLCSVVATLATVLVIGPGTAWPHASLVRSSPAARATLTRSPERVDLWFNERVEPKFSRVSVLNDQDQVVDTGEMVVGPDDARKLSVRVLSVDSHVVEGQFQFTVRAVR
jgi:methionine-rich copper-binding protein CopC